MIVADVMTRNVISVAPDATVEEAAKLMLSRGISGLFVVDETGDLVGVVTEGDLLHREEIGTSATVLGGCACLPLRPNKRRILRMPMAVTSAT